MFHKEGGKIILIATTLTVVFLLLTDQFITIFWLKKGIQLLVLFLLIMILQFFRNQKRHVVINENQIIAPVDG
ncbi:MAG: phosphatidylserine decarboxylase family protein, partial [Bacteroidota bacterium]